MDEDIALIRDYPAEANGYQAVHIARIARSLERLTGRELYPGRRPEEEGYAQAVFEASFVLVSHDTAPDPIFNYGNRAALDRFEMTWEELTHLPSRLSAEPVHREERERLMCLVRAQGYIDNYRGIRVSKNGRRFLIESALVWNLYDEEERLYGQAALFDTWTECP